MPVKQHIRRLLFPVILLLISLGLLAVQSDIIRILDVGENFVRSVTALAYFALAWLVSRLMALALDRSRGKRRPHPRLMKDLIAAVLFMVAFAATVTLFMGQGAIGALAGSGILLALLGFAIRNVVADTLSGVALGIEGPFRIGDWIDIDNLAQGKVIEIGWRTTRILTSDSTYMILPNSQIARQRITNYSAPKPQFRAQIAITLDHNMPIAKARKIMLEAVRKARLIQQDPPPDLRVLAYEEGGITYAVRYWLANFERRVDCRDEVFTIIDQALRDAGTIAPYRRIELVQSSPVAHAGPSENPAADAAE
ncbi:mechanosensitive ion channel family protein [Oceaniglobus ichthyenteri]|uniref:mechanosensitive ion channel family protein n=1 Tax=Oceaniglobus ichthyenteri TaxID=2136177 RepID=UPI000D3B5043|nr:mechanosensitive ion channel domain-containing protein [Oceaniglobus ichthyenteri]